jgi:hypothetical protein
MVTDSIFIRQLSASNNNNSTTDIDLEPVRISNDSSNRKEYSNINHYLNDCQRVLRVRLEHKNRFMYTIIFDKKNRYVAWTGNTSDRPILKNL